MTAPKYEKGNKQNKKIQKRQEMSDETFKIQAKINEGVKEIILV